MSSQEAMDRLSDRLENDTQRRTLMMMKARQSTGEVNLSVRQEMALACVYDDDKGVTENEQVYQQKKREYIEQAVPNHTKHLREYVKNREHLKTVVQLETEVDMSLGGWAEFQDVSDVYRTERELLTAPTTHMPANARHAARLALVANSKESKEKKKDRMARLLAEQQKKGDDEMGFKPPPEEAAAQAAGPDPAAPQRTGPAPAMGTGWGVGKWEKTQPFPYPSGIDVPVLHGPASMRKDVRDARGAQAALAAMEATRDGVTPALARTLGRYNNGNGGRLGPLNDAQAAELGLPPELQDMRRALRLAAVRGMVEAGDNENDGTGEGKAAGDWRAHYGRTYVEDNPFASMIKTSSTKKQERKERAKKRERRAARKAAKKAAKAKALGGPSVAEAQPSPGPRRARPSSAPAAPGRGRRKRPSSAVRANLADVVDVESVASGSLTFVDEEGTILSGTAGTGTVGTPGSGSVVLGIRDIFVPSATSAGAAADGTVPRGLRGAPPLAPAPVYASKSRSDALKELVQQREKFDDAPPEEAPPAPEADAEAAPAKKRGWFSWMRRRRARSKATPAANSETDHMEKMTFLEKAAATAELAWEKSKKSKELAARPRYTHLDLIAAAELGDAAQIKKILLVSTQLTALRPQEEVDVNGEQAGETAMYACARMAMSREIGEPGYFKMVKLVELGAKRNTGLAGALGGGGALSGGGVRWKYDEAIEALLVAGGEIDHTPRNHTPLGYGLLHMAAANGLVERVKFFLSRGASKELRANGGATPLHVACEKNHAAVVLTLLEAGASHETVDDKGRTPLHTAAAFGARFPVRMLLRNGASQTAEDENGVTPADLAGFEGKRVCESKINVHQPDRFPVGPMLGRVSEAQMQAQEERARIRALEGPRVRVAHPTPPLQGEGGEVDWGAGD